MPQARGGPDVIAWTALIEHLPPVLDGLSLVAVVAAGGALLATRCRVLSRSVRGATVGIVIPVSYTHLDAADE